jgi:hypothetical protein
MLRLFWRKMFYFGDDGQTLSVAEFRFTPLVIFLYEPNVEKYFQKSYFKKKNDIIENILRRKTFYVETNGSLNSF